MISPSPSPLPAPTPLPPVVTASGSRENHRRSAGGFSDEKDERFYIYFFLPQWKFTSVFSRRYVCVHRAPVGVRVLAIIGRHSRRGKRRRRRRSSKRRRRRRIRKNAILIRSERSGRWKFPRSGLCKGKKLRRCVVIGITRECIYDVGCIYILRHVYYIKKRINYDIIIT